eukprot:TRINITY_DN9497_c0_g1_i3.p1 TRINITY_DN9497_c0_g1~~TRINITY_DN9497_c0_g1_i3.p1  ORF type:complete len:574 (-),score=96.62 TRINITY_DN9497_c0_g1_i3:181-1797(-)
MALLDEEEKELMYLSTNGIQLNFSLLSTLDRYIYFVIRDLEIDTMVSGCEYPVMFLVDRKKLLNYEANMLELLFQWSSKNNSTFVDFFGFRLLPVILRLDSSSLPILYNLYELITSTPKTEEVEEESTKLQKQIEKYATLLRIEKEGVEEHSNQDITLSVQKLHIYPLEIKLSIGRNEMLLPILSDAVVVLKSFERSALTGTVSSLLALVGPAYLSQAWSELYKIVGDLELLTSPLQNTKKLWNGIRDFCTMPIESLVLDDTPGAFILGLIRGSQSLCINSADFLITFFIKVSSLFSLGAHILLDAEFKELKARALSQHPYNLLQGVKQGLIQLLEGVFYGLTGLITCPYNGSTAGWQEFIRGLIQGIIGVPLKPLGGIFEFFRVLLESILNSFDRGHQMYSPCHERQDSVLSGELELVRNILDEMHSREEASERVRIKLQDGRIKERYLVVTKNYLVLFTLRKLLNSYYKPKIIPIKSIHEILRPRLQETIFVVTLKQMLFGVNEFQFIAPSAMKFVNFLQSQDVKITEVNKVEKLE